MASLPLELQLKPHIMALLLVSRSKEEIIDFLNERVGYNVDYFESESEEDSPNLYPKSRKLGTPLNCVTINKENPRNDA